MKINKIIVLVCIYFFSQKNAISENNEITSNTSSPNSKLTYLNNNVILLNYEQQFQANLPNLRYLLENEAHHDSLVYAKLNDKLRALEQKQNMSNAIIGASLLTSGVIYWAASTVKSDFGYNSDDKKVRDRLEIQASSILILGVGMGLILKPYKRDYIDYIEAFNKLQPDNSFNIAKTSRKRPRYVMLLGDHKTLVFSFFEEF